MGTEEYFKRSASRQSLLCPTEEDQSESLTTNAAFDNSVNRSGNDYPGRNHGEEGGTLKTENRMEAIRG